MTNIQITYNEKIKKKNKIFIYIYCECIYSQMYNNFKHIYFIIALIFNLISKKTLKKQ